ncbi:DUF4397 domain-containing protein [Sutcliffiella rhizosphaerae]|uniref:DUF4397 domain-containing protein n=1 Tax=Sutcliffiella rhizosphaerae TaxID=2880967 RepID=A0ABN8ABV1_9BACI|nr:DUF4397 domain-containing protein [Sutcliffiella rhizosphaerae]CAG9621979.1 hypothetical protein BACCIP111883_02770 [Sutcliffiella rhizosphaerae]
MLHYSYEQAGRYQSLADYYKYINLDKHLYYYKYYYRYMYQLVSQANVERMNLVQLQDTNKIRFLHASPNTPEVDIHIDDHLIMTLFRYTNSSGYYEIPKKNFHVTINSKENKETPLLSRTIQAEENTSYTIALTGVSTELELIMIKDDETLPMNESKFRIWHLSPDTPTMDVAVKKGDVVFPDISYSDMSPYLGITPMTVDLEKRLAGTKEVIFSLNRVNFNPNLSYTIVIIGFSKGSPALDTVFLVP